VYTILDHSDVIDMTLAEDNPNNGYVDFRLTLVLFYLLTYWT